MKRTKRAKNWLQEHKRDPYVKLAQTQGYRSRAVYKLLEIQETDKIVRPGMVVIELGAAPGGWSQILSRLVGKNGQVLAIDILPMEEVPGVQFIQGDLTDPMAMEALLSRVEERPIDLVVSDMAPNLSGIAESDQARVIALAHVALNTAQKVLRNGGGFIVKLFQGRGFAEYIKQVRPLFAHVAMRKPKASRPGSSEIYLVAKGFKGENPPHPPPAPSPTRGEGW